MFEFIIIHDGQRWIATNHQFTAEAETLDHLDEKVKHYLKENKLIKPGEQKRIRFAFDNSTIPQWIRQYSNHYFNRIVEITG